MDIDYAQYFRPLVEETDSDLYLFSAPVTTEYADKFVNLVRMHPHKRPNCTLILTTMGGSPDAGYRMARTIKRYYHRFNLLLFGMCKSTGTLIALGADEIAMGDFAELGPLDIQLVEDNTQTSGLSYTQSLFTLQDLLLQHFYNHFSALKSTSGLNFSTKTKIEIASGLALGLLAPISSQLDPVKLGEVGRAVAISEEYGQRLCGDRSIPSNLIAGYRSHSFVIDIVEAQQLFGKDIVRPLSEIEYVLEGVLLSDVRHERGSLVIDLISSYLPDMIGLEDEVQEPEASEDSVYENPHPHETPEQQPEAE